MKIEAVVTCVNYADFLTYSLAHNRNIFDHIVVVTDTKDVKTQNVCDWWNIQCIQTDAWYEGGAIFNKAKGINVGLAQLSKSDWVVHMDADIIMVPKARDVISSLDKVDFFNKESLYGIDRTHCKTFEEFANFLANPDPAYIPDIFLNPGRFPLNHRIIKLEYGGYLPIGFFQMWNHKGCGLFKENALIYPEEHIDAAHSDMLFSLKWSRKKRHLIPDIMGLHIETMAENGKMGANWMGRKTKPFLPTPQTEIKIREIPQNLVSDVSQVFYPYKGV